MLLQLFLMVYERLPGKANMQYAYRVILYRVEYPVDALTGTEQQLPDGDAEKVILTSQCAAVRFLFQGFDRIQEMIAPVRCRIREILE